MSLLLPVVFFVSLGFNTLFTNCVDIEGQLKSSDGKATSTGQRILVYQGKKLLCDRTTYERGAFLLHFCLSSGESRNAEGEINTIDVFTIVGKRDTVLMASVESFVSDGSLTGNLFLPKKVKAGVKVCPKCWKSDKLYSIVYLKKEQKDFTVHPARFYCARNRNKF